MHRANRIVVQFGRCQPHDDAAFIHLGDRQAYQCSDWRSRNAAIAQATHEIQAGHASGGVRRQMRIGPGNRAFADHAAASWVIVVTT